MRKVFLDCGANVGQSVDLFKKSKWFDPSFEIFCFEPTAGLIKHLKKRNVNIIQEAAWIFDGEIEFFVPKSLRRFSQRSTVIENHSSKYLKGTPQTVKCFDFSKWLLDNFSEADYIFLKMDIEGAEYEVLEKMIKDDSISLINDAYIEFHRGKVRMNKEKHKKIKDEVRERTNLISHLEWSPKHNKSERIKT